MNELDKEWVDQRIKDRTEAKRKRILTPPGNGIVHIDAGKFFGQLGDLAVTMTHRLEREGHTVFGNEHLCLCLTLILRQVTETYNLLGFLFSDDMRVENASYRPSFNFVSLPLVRTMIDGFYNCTALLDDPKRERAFRISGFYRMRESLKADETAYGHDQAWAASLKRERKLYEHRMRVCGFTDADLANKKNKWPLLSTYLDGATTPHRQMLSKLTLGFWKEYSSISHASFDGLTALVPFISKGNVPHELRPLIQEATPRVLTMHIGRAAGILACLLTELQSCCKFDGDHIDQRLHDIWDALIPMLEVRELYDYRYKALLRKPKP